MSTTTQAITAELREWIIVQARAGCRPEDVLASMVRSGWDEEVAIRAMEETLQAHLEAHAAGQAAQSRTTAANPAESLPPAVAVPDPALDGASRVVVGGHAIDVVLTLHDPRVVVFGGLLSGEECEGLIELARPRLARSETVENQTGDSEVNPSRTSSGMFFDRGENPLCDRIERRIAELLRWPLVNGEGLQILRYQPGAEYKPHYDYFDPAQPGTPRILQRGGQRVGTLVMYLNTPERGGGTIFPDAGLEVLPVRGNAVFFSYSRAHPATKSLHGGSPVIAGEKWVATKWMREGEFR